MSISYVIKNENGEYYANWGYQEGVGEDFTDNVLAAYFCDSEREAKSLCEDMVKDFGFNCSVVKIEIKEIE